MAIIDEFLTIGILQTLAVIAPGPDFAIVVKNTLGYGRSRGWWTAVGIASGVTIHLTYCLLGLAWIISHSRVGFNLLKYAGALYLIYLGIKTLFSQFALPLAAKTTVISSLSAGSAFRQGLWCNVFNPKAAFFFMGLFTLVITPQTPYWIQGTIAAQIICITLLWFMLLASLLSYPRWQQQLARIQPWLMKMMAVLLILFGIKLLLLPHP